MLCPIMRRIIFSLLVSLSLAACGSREAAQTAPPPVAAPAPASCREALAAMGVEFTPVAIGASAGQGCTLVDGVKVTRTTYDLNRPVELTCETALRWARFEREVLKPNAERLFHQDIKTVNHAGGFVCRPMTGNGKRLSEHGHGRAIDVWGFVLANGNRISVEQDWRRTDPRGAYLRQIARQGCDFFSVVLTPNSDAEHANHLHFDIGAQRACVR